MELSIPLSKKNEPLFRRVYSYGDSSPTIQLLRPGSRLPSQFRGHRTGQRSIDVSRP